MRTVRQEIWKESFWKTQMHGICGRLPETFFQYSGFQARFLPSVRGSIPLHRKTGGARSYGPMPRRKSECPGKDEDKLLGIMAFPKLASALGRLKKIPHTYAGMRLYTYVGI